MTELKIKILEYTDDSQPGWVRCSFVDAHKKEWFFEEKAPVVSLEYLDENSTYPRDGTIRCEIEHISHDSEQLITINTYKPWSISAENGETIFTVFKDQIT